MAYLARSVQHQSFNRTGILALKIRLVLISYRMSIDRKKPMAGRNTTRLSTKFQISIPKSVRTEHRWLAGQEFVFLPKGRGVLLMPVPRAEDLAGIARGANPTGYRDHDERA